MGGGSGEIAAREWCLAGSSGTKFTVFNGTCASQWRGREGKGLERRTKFTDSREHAGRGAEARASYHDTRRERKLVCCAWLALEAEGGVKWRGRNESDVREPCGPAAGCQWPKAAVPLCGTAAQGVLHHGEPRSLTFTKLQAKMPELMTAAAYLLTGTHLRS
jgi:hypothetical protein